MGLLVHSRALAVMGELGMVGGEMGMVEGRW